MKNNLHTERSFSMDKGKFTVTRQVDFNIKEKVDRHAFQEAARSIELPNAITALEFVFITLICQATDVGKNEIWEHEGGAYITLSLPYQFVTAHSAIEVTQRFLDVYRTFISKVVEIPHISNIE